MLRDAQIKGCADMPQCADMPLLPLITMREGRKDPFASALLYMETPPNEVLYDFSCQLEEYALNREPMFWRGCKFYHDIFHGFSHKCPFVYMSCQVLSLDVGINSEICEQFNSYNQKC